MTSACALPPTTSAPRLSKPQKTPTATEVTREATTLTNASRFLQIHTLASYPATLLNRDDSGLAKRLPFGGATRTRISSQCLKRHWRMPVPNGATKQEPWALQNIGAPMGVRSREVPERRI